MSHTEGATGRLLKLKKLPDDFEEIYTIAGLMIGKANNSQDIVFFYPPNRRGMDTPAPIILRPPWVCRPDKAR